MEPMRARPVPFCFHSFLPEPATSWRVLVLARSAPRSRPDDAGPLHTAALRSPARQTPRRTAPRCRLLYCSDRVRLRSAWLPLRPPHHDVTAVGSGNRALHQQHVVLGVHFDDFEIPHRHASRCPSGRPCACPETRAKESWKRRSIPARGGTSIRAWHRCRGSDDASPRPRSRGPCSRRSRPPFPWA